MKVDGQWGYVDRSGARIIQPQFDLALPFFGGIASVKVSGKWGFVNKKGEFTINPQFMAIGGFRDQLCHAWVEKIGIARIMDLGLETATVTLGPIRSKDATTGEDRRVDSDDHMVLALNIGPEFGSLDRSGALQFDMELRFSDPFTEDLAMVDIGGKIGYINRGGAYQINPAFTYAGAFSGGLALAKGEDQYGYLDTKGGWVWRAK